VAVNDNPNDGLERDPRLAQLLAAASREEPPAALDAAILAAARREVNARPLAAGGDGEAGVPPVRALHVKRNWYVPVSIAAVLVLSVSLVTLVHQEKGDELAQPPVATSPLPKASAPVAEPPAAKPDSALSDAVSAQPKLAEDKRAEAAAVAKAPAAPESYAEPAGKQRAEKREAPTDSAVSAARRDQAASVVTREQGPAGATADAQQVAPGTAMGGISAAPRSPAASAPARERRAEPFPAVVGEREASVPAASPPPAPAARPAPALRQMAKRAVLWRGLEDQPPEKWLERLAEFKRDNRQTDADELLAEFRRRFPEHPASAR
jgi:hypothetical protein